MKVDLHQVEDAARELYVRALKILPPDIKEGFARVSRTESDATAKGVLGTMVRNIAIAEQTDNLLCQDTGIPIYSVTIGRAVEVDGASSKDAIRRGCERATREHSLRSSVVHPITRKNEQTSCGPGVPPIHVDFSERPEELLIEWSPRAGGSEQFVAAHGDRPRAWAIRLRDRLRSSRRQGLPAHHRGRGRGSIRSLRRSPSAPLLATGHRCADAEGREAERNHRGVNARGGPGAGRRLDRVRGPCRDRRHPHHDEPGRGEHAVPFRAPRLGRDHARGRAIRLLA